MDLVNIEDPRENLCVMHVIEKEGKIFVIAIKSLFEIMQEKVVRFSGKL
jgi:hypothetical protein